MGWGSYYIFWFLAPMVLALVSRHPAVIAVFLVALVARRWIPDPYLFFKHLSRIRSLRAQIEANPANAKARRDLARIYIEKHRPKKALPLLHEALERDADAEMQFLLGMANLAAGDADKSLDPFVRAVEKDTKFRYGEPYLRAGQARAQEGPGRHEGDPRRGGPDLPAAPRLPAPPPARLVPARAPLQAGSVTSTSSSVTS